MTASARARTKALLHEIELRLRSRKPPVSVDTGVLHALREFAARCYELGRDDAYRRTTVPAPIVAQPHDDTQPYSITHSQDKETEP